MNKRMFLSLAVLLVPWLLVSQAQAESVTVSLSATVTSVDDPYGVVADIQPGAPLSGQYTYETTTPDQDPTVQLGFYPHEGGSGHFNLAVGPYQVVTDTQQTNAFEIFIDDEYSPGNEVYGVGSSRLLPSNGATFNFAFIDMQAYNASALQSASLNLAPPDPGLFSQKQVHIDGVKDGQYFHVIADLTDLAASGQTASPTRYEYRAYATVVSIDDPDGLLNGRLGINSMITAGFAYDTATPNSDLFPGEGRYLHAPGTGGVSVSFADVVLNTDPTADLNPAVTIFNSDDPSGWDHMGVIGNNVISNDPAFNTAYSLIVAFDGLGEVLNSLEMPAGTLSLTGWYAAKVSVHGVGWGFEAMITSLEPVETTVTAPGVQLFPADGIVHPMQHFDMAFRVNDQAMVMGINGMNNGQDISPYLGGCAILPKLGVTQSIVCPDITQMLMPGGNTLQFQLMLDDGRVLETGVNWEVSE